MFISFRLEYCGHGFFIATNKNAFAAGFIMLFWVYCGFSGRFHSFLCEIIKRTISNDDLDDLKVVNSTKNENVSNSNYHNARDLMNKNVKAKAKEMGTKYEHYIRDLGWTSKELCVYRGPFDSDSKNLALVDSKNKVVY